MSTLTTLPQLTADQARELTDRIRFALERTWGMLLEAYERGAWVALGYDRWQDYVEVEFDISRQHSYRVLDHGRVIRALTEAAGVSPTGDIVTEREARDIKPVLPEVVETVREKVAAGAEPAAAVREAVAEAREAKRDADFSDAVHGGPALVEDEHDPESELLHTLEEQEGRIALLERENESLRRAAAGGDEVTRLNQVAAQLDGRIRQLTTTANAAQDTADRHGRLLKQIRAELGVERDRDILPAIRALREARAA